MKMVINLIKWHFHVFNLLLKVKGRLAMVKIRHNVKAIGFGHTHRTVQSSRDSGILISVLGRGTRQY